MSFKSTAITLKFMQTFHGTGDFFINYASHKVTIVVYNKSTFYMKKMNSIIILLWENNFAEKNKFTIDYYMKYKHYIQVYYYIYTTYMVYYILYL